MQYNKGLGRGRADREWEGEMNVTSFGLNRDSEESGRDRLTESKVSRNGERWNVGENRMLGMLDRGVETVQLKCI